MSELEQRVKALEAKVKILEETLETLKNMGISEQMAGYIKQKKQTLKLASLINSVSDEPELDFSKEEESLANLSRAKRTVDNQIQMALKDAGTFSDDFPDDPRYFNYEVESGMTTNTLWHRQEKNPALNRFAGKGLRITAYNGFETDRVIIPNEIDGQPVISIGEKAFMNATISEVILPKSIRAILREAFSGCKNLKHIDLPDALEYLDSSCFSRSGLTELAFPNSLKSVPSFCCNGCNDLEAISFGGQIKKIGSYAFDGCKKISTVSLPESLSEIGMKAFAETSITTIIFPTMVTKVSKDAFDDGYSRNPRKVICAFLGKDTTVDGRPANVSLIYCLPGSKIQQAAREYSIPIKPLSEFRMG